MIYRREDFQRNSTQLLNKSDIDEIQNIIDYAEGLVILNSDLADANETKIAMNNSNIYIKACMGVDDNSPKKREIIKNMYKESNKYYKMLQDTYGIDPYISRTAEDYHILLAQNKTLDAFQENHFKKCYYDSLKYFNEVTRTKAFIDNHLYREFSEELLIFMTIQRYINERMKDQFNPDTFSKTQCKNYFISNGVDYFDSLPLTYQRKLVKLLNDLMRNKGDDLFFGLIKQIFSMDSISICRYVLARFGNNKDDYSLKFFKVPYEEDFDPENNEIYTFEEITKDDPYWRSSEDDILNTSNFNYLNTKYISVECTMNLIKNSYSLSYLLYMLNDIKLKNLNLEFKDSNISSKSIDLYDAFLALADLVFKYTDSSNNFDKTEISSIKNIYGYKTYFGDENYEKVKSVINDINNYIRDKDEYINLYNFIQTFSIKNLNQESLLSNDSLLNEYKNNKNCQIEMINLIDFFEKNNIIVYDSVFEESDGSHLAFNMTLKKYVNNGYLDLALNYIVSAMFKNKIEIKHINTLKNLAELVKKYIYSKIITYSLNNNDIDFNQENTIVYYNEEYDLFYNFFITQFYGDNYILNEFIEYVTDNFDTNDVNYQLFIKSLNEDTYDKNNGVKYFYNYLKNHATEFFDNPNYNKKRNLKAFLDLFTSFESMKLDQTINITNFISTYEKNEKTRKQLEEYIVNCEDMELYDLLNKLWYSQFQSDFDTSIYNGYNSFEEYIMNKNDDLYLYITDFSKLESDQTKYDIIEERILNLCESLEKFVGTKDQIILNSTFNVLFSEIKNYAMILIEVFKAYTLSTLKANSNFEINDEFSNHIKLFDEISFNNFAFYINDYIQLHDEDLRDDNYKPIFSFFNLVTTNLENVDKSLLENINLNLKVFDGADFTNSEDIEFDDLEILLETDIKGNNIFNCNLPELDSYFVVGEYNTEDIDESLKEYSFDINNLNIFKYELKRNHKIWNNDEVIYLNYDGSIDDINNNSILHHISTTGYEDENDVFVPITYELVSNEYSYLKDYKNNGNLVVFSTAINNIDTSFNIQIEVDDGYDDNGEFISYFKYVDVENEGMINEKSTDPLLIDTVKTLNANEELFDYDTDGNIPRYNTGLNNIFYIADSANDPHEKVTDYGTVKGHMPFNNLVYSLYEIDMDNNTTELISSSFKLNELFNHTIEKNKKYSITIDIDLMSNLSTTDKGHFQCKVSSVETKSLKDVTEIFTIKRSNGTARYKIDFTTHGVSSGSIKLKLSGLIIFNMFINMNLTNTSDTSVMLNPIFGNNYSGLIDYNDGSNLEIKDIYSLNYHKFNENKEYKIKLVNTNTTIREYAFACLDGNSGYNSYFCISSKDKDKFDIDENGKLISKNSNIIVNHTDSTIIITFGENMVTVTGIDKIEFDKNYTSNTPGFSYVIENKSNKNISNVIIPSLTRIIGNYSFINSNIDEMIFSPVLSNINNSAFENSNISKMTWTSRINKFDHHNGFVFVIDPKPNFSTDNYVILNIKSSAFKNSKLKGNIKLPNNLIYCGNESFMGCSLIENINFVELLVLNYIDVAAFANCYNLKELNFYTDERKRDEPNVNVYKSTDSYTLYKLVLAQRAFANCYSISRLNGNFVAVIFAKAFENCYNLQEVKLPCIEYLGIPAVGYNSVTESYYAAKTTNGIKDFSITNDDGSIDEYSFDASDSNVRNTDYKINHYYYSGQVFENCFCLNSVYFGKTLYTIHPFCFLRCNTATSIKTDNGYTFNFYDYYDNPVTFGFTLSEDGEVEFINSWYGIMNVDLSNSHMTNKLSISYEEEAGWWREVCKKEYWNAINIYDWSDGNFVFKEYTDFNFDPLTLDINHSSMSYLEDSYFEINTNHFVSDYFKPLVDSLNIDTTELKETIKHTDSSGNVTSEDKTLNINSGRLIATRNSTEIPIYNNVADIPLDVNYAFYKDENYPTNNKFYLRCTHPFTNKEDLYTNSSMYYSLPSFYVHSKKDLDNKYNRIIINTNETFTFSVDNNTGYYIAGDLFNKDYNYFQNNIDTGHGIESYLTFYGTNVLDVLFDEDSPNFNVKSGNYIPLTTRGLIKDEFPSITNSNLNKENPYEVFIMNSHENFINKIKSCNKGNYIYNPIDAKIWVDYAGSGPSFYRKNEFVYNDLFDNGNYNINNYENYLKIFNFYIYPESLRYRGNVFIENIVTSTDTISCNRTTGVLNT